MAFSAMPLRTANDPTCVRVAVRVRPLTSQEIGQGGKSVLKVTAPEIRLGERRFTYDAVFDDDVTQQDLYQQVSAPLLTSFVDGYNATIMAYGQTGSGKTFTMGSEAHTELEVGINTGLIPRFMHGLFTSLQSKKDASDLEHSNNSLIDYHLQASFLEVYGEDVHDLLDPRRHSLPLREDSSGAIVCNGLTHRGVQTAQEVLNVLHEGTLNRTTAATLMNLTSSRSHAVFTVTLAQKYCRDGVDVSVSSRFTFVDLAGSERMKKTGAQGERAREGIKINEGLLALGNVINALAENKKAHVPYRQSKLTRLLQDALGGNSQTLFLACVSPSDTNASETLSTMHYANRARNIQNAPVQNIDAGLLELQRYKALTHVLQAELVKRAFGVLNENSNVGEVEDVLLERPDVVEYLQHLQAVAQEKQASVCVTVSPSTAATMQMTSPRAKGKTVSIVQYSSPQPNIAPGGSDSDKSVLEQFDSAFLDEVNPDEEMAILDQLLELQQRDHEFGKEKQKDDAELKQMEGELAEQQTMLLQLRESLRVYHDMKIKYEALMAEVGQLEAEKAQLAEQLDKAAADPSKGCSKAIKKELEMVEQSLARARNETRKHRQLYRKAEQEAQRCKVMERKISELKHGRANLIKKQKEAATRHREYTEARTREIATLKRKERNAEKRVGKLQTEVSVHKRNLDKRQTYITKLSTKLKQTESHLMKLLSLRNRELRDRTSATPQNRLSLCPSGRRSSVVVKKSGGEHEFASLNDEVISLKFLIERLVSERVGKVEIQAEYEQKVAEYSLTMRSMVEAVKDLEESRNSRSERLSNDTEEMVQEHEHAVGELELKVELLGSDLENLQTHLDTFEDGDETKSGSEVKNLVANQSAPVLRTLLVEICETLTEAEIERKKTTNAVSRKDSALRCLENEVDALNSRLFVFTRELADQRRTSDSQTDPLETLATIQAQNVSLTNQIEDLVRERSFLTTQTADLLKRLQVVDLDCFDAKERLAMMEVALEQVDGVAMPDQVLTKMQSLWRELGVSIDSRACVHTEIENCLADTCSRKLREVSELKATTEADILKLEQELLSMQASLGITPSVDTKLAESSLVEKLRSLRQKHAEIRPSYANAVKRREHFAKQASDLCSAMEINVQDLPAELQDIITKTSTPESDLASCQLNENFLDQCNKEITALRVKKSERLVKNSEIHKKCFVLCHEMNLIDSDVVSLVTQSARHRLKSLPGWWTSDAINCVSRAVVADAGVIRTTSSFTNHLNMVHEALEKISKSRRALSDRLRDIIERTQKTLLETVEGEVEAIDAYASFHEALFRLPALSKECIQACITEVKALVPGVEAMTQSEIEALTVVWEALSVSSGDRGNFWSRIEENSTEMQALVLRPFDELLTLSACDGEQWILSAVKDVTNQFVELETRLFKLQSIHGEVEKLRAKQEAKSSIISLDSEIRILSAELAEFEDSQCNKQRLLSKKSGSSNLLKEERFRKQMQGKFAAKLEQLSSLLKAWLSDEGTNFDSNLLSYEVSSLLQSSEHMDTWVEQRTEFMHLRTVQAKSAMKRPKSAQGEDRFSPVSRKRSARSQLLQPGESVLKKPKTSVTDTAQPRRPATFARGSKRKPSPENVVPTQARLTKASRTTRTASSSSSSSRSASPSPGKDMAKVKNIRRQPLSPKRVQRQTDSKATKANSKRLTLPPFGHVLEQASTPRNMSKENSTDID